MLRNRVFRALLTVQLINAIAVWIHVVAVQWVLTERGESALVISLAPAALAVPFILLSMPAGVIAGYASRKKLMAVATSTSAVAAGAACLFTAFGRDGVLVMVLSVLLVGTALVVVGVSWQSLLPETVEREAIPSAAVMDGAVFNVARALGPLIAGIGLGLVGAAWTFALVCVLSSTCAVTLALMERRVPDRTAPRRAILPELVGALRFIAYSAWTTRLLFQLVLFGVPSSALWALVSLVVYDRLGLGSDGFGVIMALVGAGAVIAAFALGGVRRRLRVRTVAAMTSGSTGRPKCVIQTEDALRYAAQSTIDAVDLRPGEAIGALVPLSSAAAICFGMYLPTMLGGPMVAAARWNPEAAVALLRDRKVAWTMLVPTMALQLTLVDGADGSLSAMKAMTVGGGPMNQNSLRSAELMLGTTLLRVFGMSECLGHTTPRPDDDVEVRLGRDGRPFPGTESRVVDGDGAEVGVGEVGSLQVRGPSLFLGYARNGKPVAPDVTPDGFLATGDRALIFDDGSVSIRGREKDLIIRGGRNIDINEVEAALAAIPGIHQVCVVPVPDAVLGERAAALVVPDGQAPGLDEIRRELEAADFPKFKWPEFVLTVDALPQSRVGKLDRMGAKTLAEGLASGQTA